MKKKTFVLTVSKRFPKTHKREGESTGFVESIANLFTICDLGVECNKIHTIRSNYTLWKDRAQQINEGKAILSIRYWSGMPYRSKQVEICRLEKIGVQKLDSPDNFVYATIGGHPFDWELLAKNDGLSFIDFCEWFSDRQKEPMAIIHFTNFRYETNNK